MIIFEVGEKEFQIERESLEAKAQEMIAERLGQANAIPPILKSSLKATAELIMVFVGIKPPKGVDKLEFLSAYVLKLALDAIENKPIPVDAKEVMREGNETLAETNSN